jgi:endonuclease YncB( thermonuclease family)
MLRARGRRRSRGTGKRRKSVDLLLAASILGLLALLAVRLEHMASESHAGVARVNDGDTLSIGSERIRLYGIDAPELDQNCRMDGEIYPCGRDARDALVRLLGNRALVCTGRQRDRYSRLLATCMAGEENVNRSMVVLGWAVAYGAYESEERAARRAEAGLWAGSFDRPDEWRVMHGEAADGGHAGLSRILNWLRQLFRSW